MNDVRPRSGVPPYLSVENARKAIEFYVPALGATERAAIPVKSGDCLFHAGCEIVADFKVECQGDIYGQYRDPFGHVWTIGQRTEPG